MILASAISKMDMIFACLAQKYRKAVRWCASLNRSLYWLIRFIWIGLLDFWVDWIDLVYLIDWLNGWIQYIICPKSYISYLNLNFHETFLNEVSLIKYLRAESFFLQFYFSWSDWISHSWNISRLKVFWDVWFLLVWLNIS